jgi:hypothetical protein
MVRGRGSSLRIRGSLALTRHQVLFDALAPGRRAVPIHRHSFTLSRRVPARSCANHRRLHSVYSVTFSPHHLTKTNDLKLPEIKAAFLFCNISTVETSLWGCAYPIGLFGWAHKLTALVGIASLPAQVSPPEADRRRDGGWCRNYLPHRPGGFKNSGKGFLNLSCNVCETGQTG